MPRGPRGPGGPGPFGPPPGFGPGPGGPGGRGPGPRGPMGRGGAARRPPLDQEEATAWFAGRIPDDWFTEVPRVIFDRDEILVVGRLSLPGAMPDGPDAARVAAGARITGFREDTRQYRIRIAEEAQARWQRVVSWGAACGDVEAVFTHASVPVMSRLRLEERKVLDTLIDAGVAGSRSDALAWCVNQVLAHQGEWIDRLRDAMSEVERIRAQGPGPTPPGPPPAPGDVDTNDD